MLEYWPFSVSIVLSIFPDIGELVRRVPPQNFYISELPDRVPSETYVTLVVMKHSEIVPIPVEINKQKKSFLLN